MVIGRFAPSPSGRMHLGNVMSALLAWLSARSQNGEIVLRIEDLDPARCKQLYADQLIDDLKWLGLNWDCRAENQSCRAHHYNDALVYLQEQNMVYPCYCSRDQLHAASAPHTTDGRIIYPGTCRNLTDVQRSLNKKTPAWRLKLPDADISFIDGLYGPISMNLAKEFGDIIIRRADGVAAYQLAVVVDDAANGITEVVRGNDLLSSTPVQLYLYNQLNLPTPAFTHIPLLVSPDGKRLSKREHAVDIGYLRTRLMPEMIIGMLSYLSGLIDRPEPVSPVDLISEFSWSKVHRENIVFKSDLFNDYFRVDL